ncbi:hypothetical protein scyTo_0007910 [Scyliorhinus torazame]|uniref:Uncharacterized protein n=1 Tax=Scyliorhinus torazame TaxID=75743 RepID=A0A401P0M0_SCYTO|nr:hypothetical protein [Scyliorhinus torazame]
MDNAGTVCLCRAIIIEVTGHEGKSARDDRKQEVNSQSVVERTPCPDVKGQRSRLSEPLAVFEASGIQVELETVVWGRAPGSYTFTA